MLIFHYFEETNKLLFVHFEVEFKGSLFFFEKSQEFCVFIILRSNQVFVLGLKVFQFFFILSSYL